MHAVEVTTHNSDDSDLLLLLACAVGHEVSVDVAHSGARYPLYDTPTLPYLHTEYVMFTTEQHTATQNL